MSRIRRELRLRGAVQGVGLRPWAARRATALGLGGQVRNVADGVEIALEGEPRAIAAWLEELDTAPPEGARVEQRWVRSVSTRGEDTFSLTPSRTTAPSAAGRIPPDVATCPECLRELFDEGDRRYRYPFTHCATCGPRASVIRALPYDRERTSLAAFPPCARCRAEYADPDDRRYHAEAVACADCGPQLRAVLPDGTHAEGDAVAEAAACVARGGIVAIKGFGGYHLLADATCDAAVVRLRERKARPARPFAVLVPDLQRARSLAELSPADEALLTGVHSVVVAPRRPDRDAGLSPAVAPGISDVGLTLPVAPVHWLLLYAPGSRPGDGAPRFESLVFTSANRSGEPTLSQDAVARAALADVADLIVEHDRDVLRPNDDPVHRSSARGPIPIRLSRATAPVVLRLPQGLRADPPVLALGGDLKCAPALAVGDEIILAEHVGDLRAVAAVDALGEGARTLCRVLGVEPGVVAHDLHPDYTSTQLARDFAPASFAVQHHHAHAAACLLDRGAVGPHLALALDGAGYGPDDTVWGGELLLVDFESCERLAHLERVRLPGGDAAAREPWRMAAVWLDRALPGGAPAGLPWAQRRDAVRLRAVRDIAARGVRSPWTSSCGRLFDAVASLLDLCDEVTWEGEAASRLESVAYESARRGARGWREGDRSSEQAVRRGDCAIPVADLVAEVARLRAGGCEAGAVALRFHTELARRLVSAVARAAATTGVRRVVLTGGCMQNRLLAAALAEGLAGAGLESVEHRRVPPNDGGLAAGQAVVAVASARAASR